MFERPILCHRLFFALHPPPQLARQIAASAEWFGLDGRGLRPDQLHVTLDISGDFARFPDAPAAGWTAVGTAIAAAPFTMLLDQAVGSHRSVALRARRAIAGLDRLQRAMVAARSHIGFTARAGYAFRPHMTLGYRDGTPFARSIAPIAWPVEQFVLIHSAVGRGEHVVLRRWDLRGVGEAAQPDLFGGG